MDSIMTQLILSKEASKHYVFCDHTKRKLAIQAIQTALLEHKESIIKENKKDLEVGKENGLSSSMLDRLLLNESRIESMALDLNVLLRLPDPLQEVRQTITRPNGLVIKEISTSLGVVGVIYESRPNVTVDIATLCIKTGNVCVLKGGKEAIHSNRILVSIMNQAIQEYLPEHCITLLEVTSRQDVTTLIQAKGLVDVIIPRGSAGLIQYVTINATVPVIETGAGICHQYVDKEADLLSALEITKNGKIQRPSVCNALETILIHKDVAPLFLPILNNLFTEYKVTMYGDDQVQKYVSCKPVNDSSYSTEYGDLSCNVKIVDSIEEAIEHIYQYSSKHSEVICSQNPTTCQFFMDSIDSACVYANASTRFSDGGEFGFGVEVGISTQKLHARGPMGLRALTSSKYQIYGTGQVR